MAGLATAQTTPKPATKSGSTAAKKPATKTATTKSAAKPKADDPTAPSATGKPHADFITTEGTLSCDLANDKVPHAVANFVGLATGSKDWTDPKTGQTKHGVPAYDGTIFHRVIPNFMIQGGDPGGDGSGQIGFTMPDEFSPDLKFDKPGVLAYANRGPNTNAAQFFITEVPYPFLDPCLDENGCMRGMRQVPKGYGYVVFGQCSPETVELVKKIAREPRGESDRPDNPVTIKHIKITGMPKAAGKPAAKPATKGGASLHKTGSAAAPKAAPKQ